MMMRWSDQLTESVLDISRAPGGAFFGFGRGMVEGLGVIVGGGR